MILLIFISVLFWAAVIYVALTQVILPLTRGQKTFPAFRENALKQKVDNVSDEVSSLKTYNENLAALDKLLKEKSALEQSISKHENSNEGNKNV